MSTEYLIKKETLEAIADKIRLYTVPVGDATHVFSWGTDQLPTKGIKKFYSETFDTDLIQPASICTSQSNNTTFSTIGYANNDQGDYVPVLYERNGDAYYYVGQAEMGGQILDKWRKIEVTFPDDDENWATWTSGPRVYVYTEPVVTVSKFLDVSINPTDFPTTISTVFNLGMYDGTIEFS